MLADGILVREKASCKGLIDQGHRYRRTVVGVGKYTPRDERDAHYSKVVRGNQAALNSERLIRLIYRRAPFNGECIRMSTHCGWELVSSSDCRHSGQRPDSFNHLCVKRGLFCRLGVRILWQFEPRREDVPGLEARLHLEQSNEAADQETGPNEQDQRECDFGNRE